jgi:hypothetical protein
LGMSKFFLWVIGGVDFNGVFGCMTGDVCFAIALCRFGK